MTATLLRVRRPGPVAVRSIHAMADGDRADFDALYHPRGRRPENRVQPPSSRSRDRPGSTRRRCGCVPRSPTSTTTSTTHRRRRPGRGQLDDERRHVAPWAVYTEDGAVDTVFPPTNRTFAMTQSHWFRIEDGRIVEHWANRDDIGIGQAARLDPTDAGLPDQDGGAKRRAVRS